MRDKIPKIELPFAPIVPNALEPYIFRTRSTSDILKEFFNTSLQSHKGKFG